ENRERIAMRAGNNGGNIAGPGLAVRFAGSTRLLRQAAPLSGYWMRCRLLMQSHQAGTFQISFAYSRIVRSEENQPTRATLRIALEFQSGLLRQTSSTVRWVAA